MEELNLQAEVSKIDLENASPEQMKVTDIFYDYIGNEMCNIISK